MAVAKKLKAGTRLRLRRARPKARIRDAADRHNRPAGYFKDALAAEDIEQDNRMAEVVARMNARRLS